MNVLQSRLVTSVLVAICLLVVGLTATRTQAPPRYRVVMADATESLTVVRRSGSTDMVELDALVEMFDLLTREDARTGGVVVSVRSQRVALIPGQATVSAGRRLVSLSAPIAKDDDTWLVPVDFLRVLAPLLDRRIEIRRASRLVIVDDVVVPQLQFRFDRTSSGRRLTVRVDPATAASIDRRGNQVTIRFRASALDAGPLTGATPDWISSVRTDGPSLLIDLGSAVANVREGDGRDRERITLDLVGSGPSSTTSAPPDRPNPRARRPSIGRANTVPTIVIDPGHGGADAGRRAASGTTEKQITLAVAQQVKRLLETRLGVRVLLTREADTDVAIDRRAALANNNKADLFVSLHTNGSPVGGLRGWQIQSLDPADYGGAPAPGSDAASAALSVPVVGGGTRLITTVPWHLAQIPHVTQSSTLAQMLATRLLDAGLVSQPTPLVQAPLRVLIGANMPAVLLELGFLSNAEDAALLTSGQYQNQLAEIIVAAIGDLRSDTIGRHP